MKTFRVIYLGNASRFRNFKEEVQAESIRMAVEMVYASRLDEDYFPEDDGVIKDCDGNIIANSGEDRIWYDGGYFSAEEVLYKIQDREAGNIIETGLTYTEAQKTLKEFEETDKKEGTYTPDFYEIVEE